MTASLRSREVLVPSMSPGCDGDLAVRCLGAAPALCAVSAAALGGDGGTDGEPDGVLVVLEAWSGAAPAPDVVEAFEQFCTEGLRGRSIGLIVVSADIGDGARCLAWIRQVVRMRGAFPVGAGICVDSADVVASESGWVFADVTVPASLALLGQRVRTVARSRRILRAA